MKGNVFIVTNNSQNIKLGLVEVRAIPEDKVLAYMASKKTAFDARHAQLLKEQSEAQTAYHSAVKSLDEADARFRSEQQSYTSEVNGYDYDNMSFSELLDARSRTSSMQERIADYKQSASEKLAIAEAALSHLSAINEKMKSASNAKLYYEGLPAGIASAVTNADGDFTLKLPAKGRHLLAAHAKRQVFDKTEEYYWLVWASLAGKSTHDLLLSNQNLADSGSADSLLTNQLAVSGEL